VLAEAARKKLTTLALGSDQERALREAATTGVQRTIQALSPDQLRSARVLKPSAWPFHVRILDLPH
jgi:hypothetical protein